MSAQKEKNINKQTIDNFNPDTMSFEQSCQDFLLKILEFDAGSGYENLLEKNMQALYSVDSEYTPMYLTLKPVYINYDE